MSQTDELSRLAELHRQGDLTDEEFAGAKKGLLGATNPISTPTKAENDSIAQASSSADKKALDFDSLASSRWLTKDKPKKGSTNSSIKRWMFLIAGLIVVALIAIIGKYDNSNSSNIQSPDSGAKRSVDSITKPSLNVSYQISKESFIGDSSNNWGLVTVELSKEITDDDVTVLANRLRESKSNYGNLSIVFTLKGMADSGRSYATARFDPDLHVSRLGSTDEEQQRAALVIKQYTQGKVIGRWHEDWRIASSDVFFELNGKTYERRIFEGGILEKSGSGPYPGENMELIKKKIRGSTRFYEKDGLDDYFVINKDGNLEFYDQDGGYITTGFKIQ